jgi:hypothetical protein
MPRRYIPHRIPVERTKIQECIEFMQNNGTSLNAAAKTFGLSEATVRRHYKSSLTGELLPHPGGQPSIPADLQAEIAMVSRTASSHGCGLMKEELRALIGSYVHENWEKDTSLGCYLRKNCRFTDHIPSNDWITQFMHNHHLSLKKPQPLQRCRKENASDPFIIYEFFDLLEAEISRLNIADAPGHVWNVDESAFHSDPRGVKIVAAIGEKVHRSISGSGRYTFTAMACVSGAGVAQPPLVIFEGKNLYSTWKGKHDLPGTMYACSGKEIKL